MSVSAVLEHISNSIDHVSRWFLAILMAVMVIDVLLGVFNRFFFKLSISWTEELARFLMIWISMIGTSIALKKGSHVSITSLINRFGKLRIPILSFNFILLGSFLALVCFFGLKLCFSQAGQLSPALRLSMLWPLLAIPSGSLIMLFHVFAAMTSQSQLLKMNGCESFQKNTE